MSFEHIDSQSLVHWFPPVTLALILFLPSLLQGFPSSERRDVMETSHLGPSIEYSKDSYTLNNVFLWISVFALSKFLASEKWLPHFHFALYSYK